MKPFEIFDKTRDFDRVGKLRRGIAAHGLFQENPFNILIHTLDKTGKAIRAGDRRCDISACIIGSKFKIAQRADEIAAYGAGQIISIGDDFEVHMVQKRGVENALLQKIGQGKRQAILYNPIARRLAQQRGAEHKPIALIGNGLRC